MASMASSEVPAAFVVMLARSTWVSSELRVDAEGGREDYCVCLLERQPGVPFSPDWLGLPGGPMHSMDHAIATGQLGSAASQDPLPLGLRVAGVREVFSETGVLLASPAPPPVLREATREILRRDGPRVFLDCMIMWDDGNPFPHLTLCPLEELTVLLMPNKHAEGGTLLETHFFIAEVPDADELSWAKSVTGSGSRAIWMKPSELLYLHRSGKMKLAPPEHLIIVALSEHLVRLADLPTLLSDMQTRRDMNRRLAQLVMEASQCSGAENIIQIAPVNVSRL